MASSPQAHCIFCDKYFSGRGITRHLTTHLKALPTQPRKKALHLKVTGYSPYFLHLLVDRDTTLGELDQFLRDIWLECCGHLSSFGYERWGEELPMDMAIGEAMGPGEGLAYAYDFGSTTELVVNCLESYALQVENQPIHLLSRNEPPDFKCHYCQKNPATTLCPHHYEDDDPHLYCEACEALHEETCDEAEYAAMPVVNSPRMGECAYEGGTIDRERD